MTFGEKLQLLRKQNGLSQEQLASQLTVSRQSISKWELGATLPDTENVIQLSKLLGVSIDYLLKDEIENDNDIPINTAKLESKFHATIPFILGSICTGIGCIGNLTLIVLSTMIQVHVTKKRILADGSIEYYGGGDVLGYSFKTFIQEYRLQALLFIFIILVISGIIIIIKTKRTQQDKTKE